eukprot:1160373_1
MMRWATMEQQQKDAPVEPMWKAVGKMALVVGSLFIAHEVLKYNAKKTQSDAITDKDGVAIDLSPRQWAEFRHNGFVKVGRTMTDEEVKAIQQRTKDIMSGAVRYGDKLLM